MLEYIRTTDDQILRIRQRPTFKIILHSKTSFMSFLIGRSVQIIISEMSVELIFKCSETLKVGLCKNIIIVKAPTKNSFCFCLKF